MRIFRATRFLFATGLRVDAMRLWRATVLAVTLYVAAPLAALALRDLTDDLLAHRAAPALAAAVLASVALTAQIMLGHFCHLDLVRVEEVQQMRLRGLDGSFARERLRSGGRTQRSWCWCWSRVS